MAAPTLVVADYPIGYASGFGETLFNLFDGFPPHLLWSAHPKHLSPTVGKDIYRSIPFLLPQPPQWWPQRISFAYYPALKTLQATAVFRTAKQLIQTVRAHSIEHLLVIPVTPWILAAALEVLDRCSRLKLALFIMDDWQGHHEAYGLPFTRWRQRLLSVAVNRATVRFAVSREMASHYQETSGHPWVVAHNGLDAKKTTVRSETAKPPRRAVLTGDINVFRFDAALSFGQALERYNQRHHDCLELLVLGDVASDCRQDLSSLKALKLLGRRPQSECMSVVAQADLLYLPLAFDPFCRRISRYSMPTKLPEYLSSGKPILFHAPADSAIQAVARRHNLQPQITSIDAPVLDSFVDAWVNRHSSVTVNIDGLRSALTEEFDLKRLSRQFQDAFA